MSNIELRTQLVDLLIKAHVTFGTHAVADHLMEHGVVIQPTAEGKRLVGRWILEKLPDGKPYCYHCSECDSDFRRIEVKTKTPYCPYCGIRMED